MADEALAKTERDRQHRTDLQRRRELLRKQLTGEQTALEQEAAAGRAGSRARSVSTEMLRKISDTSVRTAEEKRRADLESKLYRRIRLDARQDAILHDARSDHEVLAKMNWLDRQVAQQVDREAERCRADERSLRLHEEARKHLECLADRRQRRDIEIAQLKAEQSVHVADLQRRVDESDRLRTIEQSLSAIVDAVEAERQQLGERQTLRLKRASLPYSSRCRIKMVLRERSKAVCEAINQDSAMLERLRAIVGTANSTSLATIRELHDTFRRTLSDEKLLQQSVEAMYDSEAKQRMGAQERAWNESENRRAQQLERICAEITTRMRSELHDNQQRQRNVLAVRESLLQAAQASNQRLKELLSDQRSDELTVVPTSSSPSSTIASASNAEKSPFPSNGRSSDSISNYSNSSDSLSGGCIVDRLRPPARGGGRDSVESLQSSTSFSSVSSSSSTSSGPRFGRKKIEWT